MRWTIKSVVQQPMSNWLAIIRPNPQYFPRRIPFINYDYLDLDWVISYLIQLNLLIWFSQFCKSAKSTIGMHLHTKLIFVCPVFSIRFRIPCHLFYAKIVYMVFIEAAANLLFCIIIEYHKLQAKILGDSLVVWLSASLCIFIFSTKLLETVASLLWSDRLPSRRSWWLAHLDCR